jgi:starch phosphorylase
VLILRDAGSYFPAQPGANGAEEWPIGDESTWKTALESEEVDPDDVQGVANSVVRHVTTTLARQAANMDTVSRAPLP